MVASTIVITAVAGGRNLAERLMRRPPLLDEFVAMCTT